MKTLNTLTSKTSNFEKKVLYAWNTLYGIEVGSRNEWLCDSESINGCVKFISKHIDMFAGTQHERELYIKNKIIDKLVEKNLAFIGRHGISFLRTNETITIK